MARRCLVARRSSLRKSESMMKNNWCKAHGPHFTFAKCELTNYIKLHTRKPTWSCNDWIHTIEHCIGGHVCVLQKSKCMHPPFRDLQRGREVCPLQDTFGPSRQSTTAGWSRSNPMRWRVTRMVFKSGSFIQSSDIQPCTRLAWKVVHSGKD